jgi:hypothetical protein
MGAAALCSWGRRATLARRGGSAMARTEKEEGDVLLFGAGKGSCRASAAMEEQGAGVLPRSSAMAASAGRHGKAGGMGAMAAGGSLLLPAMERREWRWAEIRPEVEEGLGRHPWERLEERDAMAASLAPCLLLAAVGAREEEGREDACIGWKEEREKCCGG